MSQGSAEYLPELLYPELIMAAPILGHAACYDLERRAEFVAQTPVNERPFTVLIRTLNHAERIDGLFDDITNQEYDPEKVDILVVDNESTDGTDEISHARGARVIQIPRDGFSYAAALKAGVNNARYDIISTVGHANFSNRQAFRAACLHVGNPAISGAYGSILPGPESTKTEQVVFSVYNRLIGLKDPMPIRGIDRIKIILSLGIMASDRGVFSIDRLSEQPFDESYEMGGEDSAWGRAELAVGKQVVYEPLLSMHHTHGLGPVNFVKQILYWHSLNKPRPFDLSSIAARRPDLNFD